MVHSISGLYMQMPAALPSSESVNSALGVTIFPLENHIGSGRKSRKVRNLRIYFLVLDLTLEPCVSSM